MTRRGPNEGTIHLRGDGRWVAALHLGYDDRGHRRRKYVYGKTRAEVASKLQRAQQELGDGVAPPPERLTVGQLLESYLDAVRNSVRPSTQRSYEGIVAVHLRPALGRIRLRELSVTDVQRLLNSRHVAGRSARTVERIRAVLRQALGQALRQGLVGRNVASLARPPRVLRRQVDTLDPDAARAFLAATLGTRDEALYAVALALGLRQGEALGLRWQDVDLETGEIRITHALQRVNSKLELVEPKSLSSRRRIPLPAVVASALRDHRRRQLGDRLVSGSRWIDNGLVFATRDGKALDGRNVTRRFQAALATAGLPRMRFHDLRHSCASLLLAQGVSPRVVMETLGHSQVSLTLNTYAHVLPPLQRDAADRMHALLTHASGGS